MSLKYSRAKYIDSLLKYCEINGIILVRQGLSV